MHRIQNRSDTTVFENTIQKYIDMERQRADTFCMSPRARCSRKAKLSRRAPEIPNKRTSVLRKKSPTRGSRKGKLSRRATAITSTRTSELRKKSRTRGSHQAKLSRRAPEIINKRACVLRKKSPTREVQAKRNFRAARANNQISKQQCFAKRRQRVIHAARNPRHATDSLRKMQRFGASCETLIQ